jgi:hypothetical protein
LSSHALRLYSPRNTELRGSARARHSSGSYYTPEWLVDRVAEQALRPLADVVASPTTRYGWRDLRRALSLRILDPAAGDGNFLVGAAEYLAGAWAERFASAALVRRGELKSRFLAAIVRRCLFGFDLHAEATAAARARLHALAGMQPANHRALRRHLVVGDSLRTAPLKLSGTFDAVIGNPPYVDAETMTRDDADLRAEYVARWSTARGNWDLFVPFVELSLQCVRPGGQVALVVPNKILSARYAGPLRRLLRTHRLRTLTDVSTSNAFEAADVYPLVLHVERSPQRAEDSVRVESHDRSSRGVPAALLTRLPDEAWHGLLSPEIESVAHAWRDGIALGEVAAIHGAATVAEAYALQDALVDSSGPLRANFVAMVNTGTVRRYTHAWGQTPMRYLGGKYVRPAVSRSALERHWPRRAQQSRSPKLIVAGLAREPRAVLDAKGELLAGKSTLVVTSSAVDLRLLAALVNSQWMSRFYRAHFGGLAMQGGYLQFTTAHLKAIPIPSLTRLSAARPLVDSICGLVDMLMHTGNDEEFARIDEEIEQCVTRLLNAES